MNTEEWPQFGIDFYNRTFGKPSLLDSVFGDYQHTAPVGPLIQGSAFGRNDSMEPVLVIGGILHCGNNNKGAGRKGFGGTTLVRVPNDLLKVVKDLIKAWKESRRISP